MDHLGGLARVLAALFALPMTREQLALYSKLTGRTTPPTQPFHEAWLCIGRRGGKSFILAVIAVFLACFKDWRPFLGPGEVATVMIIAADRRQARVIMRYSLGCSRAVPMLAQLSRARPARASRCVIASWSRCILQLPHNTRLHHRRGAAGRNRLLANR